MMKTQPRVKPLSNQDVTSSEDLHATGVRGDSAGHPLESAQDGGGGSDFSLFDAGLFGDLEDGLFVEFLDGEESPGGAHGGIEKLTHAAQGHIPKPSRRRRAEVVEKLTADDFEEGAERNAFLVVEDHARKLFAAKSAQKHINSAIDFFFTVEDKGTEITFPLCCDVLGARVDILRLRIQYEWWLRGTIFTGPFPFMTVPVPRTIAGEITYYGGEEGYALAREAWVQPGITSSELIEGVAELDGFAKEKLKVAMERLEERFLMSSQGSLCYVTGRNPLLLNMRAESVYGINLMRGGSFYWSRLFGRME
jgi:hypothetical protein